VKQEAEEEEEEEEEKEEDEGETLQNLFNQNPPPKELFKLI
jgi:hypothetical protein